MESPVPTNDSDGLARLMSFAMNGSEFSADGDTLALDASGDRQGEATGFPRIPGYRVIGQLGEGGMGAVWRAEQLATRRVVALKLLANAALGSPRARARFEREVDLASRLEHPNIARVYDSGTARGICYYAMELVEGRHLDAHVKQQQLDARAILELMHAVCEAVQYAHQRGVIHRDLKPSNILVTDDGQPHIVDFGLARPVTHGDGHTVTQAGDPAGTPAFMAPEQASGHADRIDTRTDVYGLGATLYLLLTGHTPHDCTGPTHEVIQRVIRQDVRPPRKMNPALDTELESLLLKALSQDPDRRYASVGGMARDIGRYLRNEVVEACPPTRTYRIQKFVSRHRAGTTAVCAVVIALLGGSIAATVGTVQAHRATARAIIDRDRAIRAQQAEAAQRMQAQAVAALLESIFQTLNPFTEGRQTGDLKAQLVSQLDAAAAKLNQDYAGDPIVQARLRSTLGKLESDLGQYAKAEGLFRATLADRRIGIEADGLRTTLAAREGLAKVYQKTERFMQAIQLLEQARDDRIHTFGPDHRDTVNTLECLGWSYHLAGRNEDARKLLEYVRDREAKSLGPDDLRLLGTLADLATVYGAAGRNDDAIAMLQKLRAQEAKLLGRDHPRVTEVAANLAMRYESAGRHKEAEEILLQAKDDLSAKLGSAHPDVLTVLINLGAIYSDAGRDRDAIAILEEVRNQRISKLDPSDPRAVTVLESLGRAYGEMGRFPQEIELYMQAANRLKETRGATDPDTLVMESNLAAVYLNAGITRDAIALGERVRDLQTKTLGPDHPDTLRTISNLAAAYGRAGRAQEAIKLGEEIRDRQVKNLGLDHPDTLNTVVNLAISYRWTNRPAEELKTLEQLRDRAFARIIGGDEYAHRLLTELAFSYRTAGRAADAINLLERLRDLEVAKLGPDHPLTLDGQRHLGKTYREAGRYGESIQLLQHVRDQQIKVLGPEHAGTLTTLKELGLAYQSGGRNEDAITELEKAWARGDRDMVRDNLAKAYRSVGRTKDALELSVLGANRKLLAGGSTDPRESANRGRALARMGRFSEAAAEFEQAIRFQPADRLNPHQGLPVLLWAGRLADYKAGRAQALQRFGADRDPATSEMVSKACLMLNLEGKELSVATDMADRAVDSDPHSPWYAFVKGLAEYRRGEYSQSVSWLSRSVHHEDARCVAASEFYLAMDYYRIGKSGESRAALARGVEIVERQLGKAGEDDLSETNFQDWILAQVARREAETLINGKSQGGGQK